MTRPSIPTFALALLGFAAVGLAGCQHAVTAPSLSGQSAFRFVEAPVQADVSAAKAQILAAPREPIEGILPAEPILPLIPPTYPRVALGTHAAPVVVGVRINVDANGGVTSVGPSLVSFSTPTPRAGAFYAAVEEAVTQWRFEPAEWRHLVPMTNNRGAGYWKVTRAEKTDYAFDLAFTFTTTGDVLPVPRP
jgi:hypothetical protein